MSQEVHSKNCYVCSDMILMWVHVKAVAVGFWLQHGAVLKR